MAQTMLPETPAESRPIEPYAWYLLIVLMLVYVLNFVDRQLLAILAPDLKRDLGISDSDFGFLYGTAFGVFYALFGIPLGKLADRWSRVRLLTIGLSLWSIMTAISGFSRNFGQIAIARVGVGIGEAAASPCSYSLISDYFPPKRRATALGIYSAGLYIGGGVSLFLGSRISSGWNAAYAGTSAPLGLAGWQAAFLAVGLPGLLLAVLVSQLREPTRGLFDGDMAQEERGSPWPNFWRDLGDIVPPFTFAAAAMRGKVALAQNLIAAILIAALSTLAIWLSQDSVQWIAFGIGAYAIYSWIASLRHREPETFKALMLSRSFIGLTLGYALVAFVGYANTGFAPLYAIQELGLPADEAGLILGSIGASCGAGGIIAGGLLADYLARHGNQARRVSLVFWAAIGMMIFHGVMFSAKEPLLFYLADIATLLCMSGTLGGVSGALVNTVPAHLRGIATAGFLLGTNMIGLALGPYAAGKLSAATGDLGQGLTAMLFTAPIAIGFILLAYNGTKRMNAALA